MDHQDAGPDGAAAALPRDAARRLEASLDRLSVWPAYRTVPTGLDGAVAASVQALEESLIVTDARLAAPGPTILWVNDGFTRVTGYLPDEVIGRSPAILDGPRSDADSSGPLRDAIVTGRRVEGEHWAHRKDGTPVQIHCTYVPTSGPDGAIRSVLVHQRDVTRQRQSDLELARRTRELETMISHSPDVIVRIDPADRIAFATDAAEMVLGVRAGAIRQRPLAEVARAGEDLDALLAATKAVRAGGASVTLVIGSPFGELGRHLEVRIVAERSSRGGIGDVVWFARDVSERVTTERRLRESEARERERVEERLRQRELQLSDLAESIPVFIWMTDPAGVDLYANGSWLEFCGFLSVGPGGDGDWRDRIVPEDRGAFNRSFAKAIGQRVPFDVECRMKRADGEERTVVLAGIPRFDESRFLGFLGSAMDVTDRRTQDETERRAIADLEHASRLTMAGQMAAAMVHEMAQPLSAVATFVEIAMVEIDRGEPPARVLATLRDAQESALRAGMLSRRMLGFVRRSEATNTRFDLGSCIHKALGLMTADANSHRVVLQYDGGVDRQHVQGDPVELEQVFCNLVRNAIEAIESTGEAGTIEVTGRRVLDRLEVDVRDDGPGVPEDLRREIFEAFRTRKRTGIGLGLWICWNILERHDGEIRLDETVRNGTCFRLVLPTFEAAERAVADRGRRSDVHSSGDRIEPLIHPRSDRPDRTRTIPPLVDVDGSPGRDRMERSR